MSNYKYSEELIQKCCEDYRAGVSVAAICEETGVSRSSVYAWIAKLGNDDPIDCTYKKTLAHLRSKYEKALQIIEILKVTDCTVSAPLRERLYALEKLQGSYSVRVLCEALNVDRGTFYNHLKRNKKGDTEFAQKKRDLTEMVLDIYNDSRGVYGRDKIHAILQQRGITTSPQTVAKIMCEQGITSMRTTAKRDYYAWRKTHETNNVLRQNFTYDKPNMVWVGDCTQINLFQRKYHICAIVDLFSRKVVAYKVSQRPSTRLVTDTFKMAYAERNPEPGLIFHSDQGCQYTSHAYRELMQNLGVIQSFSKKSSPHDNAVIESFFATLKQEELYRERYASEVEFKRRLKNYIEHYNSIRPHRTNKNLSPDQKECAFYAKTASSCPV